VLGGVIERVKRLRRVLWPSTNFGDRVLPMAEVLNARLGGFGLGGSEAIEMQVVKVVGLQSYSSFWSARVKSALVSRLG